MDIGQLNEIVTISRNVDTSIGKGDFKKVPTSIGNYWMKVRPMSQKEQLSRGAEILGIMYELVSRYDSAIDFNDLLFTWEGKSLICKEKIGKDNFIYYKASER